MHLNQIIREASGEYFHLLNDDDEISSNFVSELVGQLELHPEASLAYARLEIINKEGVVVRKSKDNFPSDCFGARFYPRNMAEMRIQLLQLGGLYHADEALAGKRRLSAF